MLPDVTLKDYYLQFVHNAKVDASEYKQKLEDIIIVKESLYDYISNYKDVVASDFNINLNKFNLEWVNKTFNPSQLLYRILIKMVKTIDEHPNRIIIVQLIKYCNILALEHKYNRMIVLCDSRKNMKFNKYRQYVSAYYNKVHRCVLQGMGYQFSYGIGTFVINRWKLDAKLMVKKPRLDYNESNKRRKELIAKGIKLYDDKEAAWYAARKIPYDAVDWRVWKTNTCWYELTFIKSRITKSCNYDYKHTEYIASKYRGMTYREIADKVCRTEEDIYNLQVDIKYKLNILLYKDPTKYLNYVRNAEQRKYQCRAYNS